MFWSKLFFTLRRRISFVDSNWILFSNMHATIVEVPKC